MSVAAKVINLGEPSTAGAFQEASGALPLERPSRVFLDLRPADISAYAREGRDLIVNMGEENLRIVNFYNVDGDSQLYLKGDDCDDLILADLSPVTGDGPVPVQYVAQEEASPFESLTECAAAAGAGDGYELAAVGLAMLGGGAAAIALALGGGSSHAAHQPQDTTPPAAPTINGITDDAGSVIGPVGLGGSTDDTLPTVDGSGATPGDTITLFDGNTEIGSATVGADGTWSITPTVPLIDGSHSFTVTATDPAGNVSTPSMPYDIIVDTNAPVVTLDGLTTNDNTPALTGTVDDPSATVVVTVGGVDYIATNNGDGTWTLADNTLPVQPDGTTTITVTATDPAGNSGTGTGSMTIDTTAPAVTLDGLTTNDNTPALTGTVDDPAATVVVTVGGVDYPATNNGDGTWTLADNTLPVQPDGSSVVTVTATDAAGNSGTDTGTVTIDTIAPTTTINIDGITDDTGAVGDFITSDANGLTVGATLSAGLATGEVLMYSTDGGATWTDISTSVTGTAVSYVDPALTSTATVLMQVEDAAANIGPQASQLVTIDTVAPVVAFTDLTTNDNTPALAGTVDDPAATVVVTVGGVDYPATNNGDGTWTLADNTLPVQPDGSSVVTVTATDVAGNSGTDTGALTIDTGAGDVTAPVVAFTDLTTNDTTPALSGTVDDPTATIVVTVNSVDYPATNNGDGTWTLADNAVAALAEGDTGVIVTATDLASNIGNDTGIVTVDTTAPVVSFTDQITNDATPALSGTVDDPTATVVVTVSGVDYTATNNGDGTWTLADNTLPVQPDGSSVVTVTATDVAGNSGTDTGALTIDTGAGDVTAPIVAFTDLITNDTTPALSGTVDDPTATIVVTVNGVDYPATNNGDGTWTLADNAVAALAEGNTGVTVTATDPASNIGNDTGIVTVDTTAPVVSFTDLTTNDTTPALSGTVDDPTATVVVTVSGVDYTATNNGNGTWTLADNAVAALAEGDTGVTVTATDLASNIGTDTGTVTIDTIAPTTTLSIDSISVDSGTVGDFITNDNDGLTVGATLSAGLVAGESLMYSTDGGATWTDISSAITGTAVSYVDPALTSTATVLMQVEDTAGNAGPQASQLVTIDTVAPTTTLTIDSISVDSGTVGDFITNDNDGLTVGATLSAGLVAGESLMYSTDGGATWIDISSAVTGTAVSYVDPALTSTATVLMQVEDTAGNAGPQASQLVTIDATAPVVAFTDLITNDNTPALTGTVDDSTATVVVTVSGVDYTAINNGDGTWTLADNTLPVQPDGSSIVTVTATDVAGNSGTDTGALTIDTGAGDVTAPIVAFTDLITNDTTPALSGTVDDPTATIVVTVNGVDYPATNNGDGTWTLADNAVAALAEGNTGVTVTATDPASNIGTDTGTVTIDTIAPTTTLTIDSISVDSGTVGDFITNDNDGLTVGATLSAGLVAGEALMYSTDGGATWTDISSAVTGTAVSYVDPALTSTATVLMQVEDTAGNAGPQASQLVTIDTVAPTTTLSIDSITDDTGTVGDFITNDNDGLTVGATLSAGLVAGEALMYSTDGGATWTDISSAVTGTAVSYVDPALTSTATVLMQVEDTAGNAGPQASQLVTIDTVAPTTTLTIDSISVDSGTVGDFITNDNDGLTVGATLSAGLVAGESLMYSIDGGATWTDISSAVTGTAVSYVDPALTSTATVLMQVEDTAGNAGPQASQLVTIDTVAPTTTLTIDSISVDSGTVGDFITNDNDGLTVGATLSAGLVVGESLMYSTDGGATWTDISSAVTGTAVSYVDPALTSTATVLMQVEDTAGNAGPQASQLVTIDTVAPTTTLTIDSITDDSGAVGDFITNDNDGLTVGATLSAGLVAGEALMYSTDGGATWTDISSAVTGTAVSYVDPALTSTATVLMQVEDTAGNAGPQASQLVTIDTVAPTTTLTIDSITDDSGAVGDFITNDNDGLTVGATLSAGLVAGESLMYSTDGGATWTDISSAVTGTAVSYVDPALTSTATVLMQVEDTAGNAGPQASQLVTIDTTAPTVLTTAANVSEEGLPGGVPDTVGTPTDTTNLASVSGTLAIGDVGSSVSSASVSGPVGVTSGGTAVTWGGSFAAGTYTLTGTAGAITVATLTLTTAGAYNFVLEQPLDHPLVGVEDILGIDFAVTATDAAGNNSVSGGSLTINVEDDMPVAAAPALFSITTTPTMEAGTLVDSFGADGGHVQQITIDGNTFRYDVATDNIIVSGNSELVVSHSFNAGTDELTINTVKGETLVVNMLTGGYSYEASGVPLIAPEVAVAPVVDINTTGGLLGIVGADLLGLVDLSLDQFFTATDGNNNITSVVLDYHALLAVGAFEFNASLALATELGLSVGIVNNPGLLGIGASSVLTITTNPAGGPIDNLKLNELLGTVTFSAGLLSLSLLSDIQISALDAGGLSASVSAASLLNASLLGTTPPSVIQEGAGGNDTLTGAGLNDRLYGHAGDDTLTGNAGNDILRGGAGTDSLDGGDGNDILIGGAGTDTLTGGTGVDVFLWESTDQGTAGLPATDTVVDFNFQPLVAGGDVIDLGNMLQGEGKIGSTPGNLTNYLHFEVVGADTVLHISTTGQFVGGYTPAAEDQQITFTGVNLVGSFTTDQEVIANLLNHGNLIVDEATTATDLLAGTTTVDAVIIDNDGDTAGTSVSFDSTGASAPAPDPNNVAPVVQVDTSALLGVVGLGALNIINMNTQALAAADANGNLNSVVVAYQPLLSVALSPLQLTASSQLAAELGLEVTVTNDAGLLGLVAPSSVLTITALGGGNIDNLAVNELLATVRFDDTFALLGVDVRVAVLDATTITATDSAGLTASDSVSSLLSADALNTLQGTNPDIIEGTSGNDTLTSSAAGTDNERLYGHDGNDSLSGGTGNDLLRGGAGDDTLDGGDGNDVLIDGNGNDTFIGGIGDDAIVITGTTFVSIDGGTGFDILQMDGGFALDLSGATNVSNIEQIDLGTGDAGSTLTLTAAAVTSLTDVNNQLYISGETNDTLNAVGAVDTLAQTSLNGAVFEVYSFGANQLLVDPDVIVNVV